VTDLLRKFRRYIYDYWPTLSRSTGNTMTSNQIPRYYQIVVKVKFMDGIPTDVSYVLHRDLSG
jgi:hypothetical protein